MIMMTKVNYNKNTQEDIQMALEYAMYMMLTSYYDHAECRTPIYEDKLYLRYKAQRMNDQYKLEDYCLRYIERELLPKYPAAYWKQSVEVRLMPTEDGCGGRILISDKRLELDVRVEYRVRKKKEDMKNRRKKYSRPHKSEEAPKTDIIRITHTVRVLRPYKKRRKEVA